MRKALSLVLTFALLAIFGVVIAPASAQDATAAATAAAGTLSDPITMPAQIAGGRPVTITVTNMPPETDTALRKEWDEQIARFQALYPNVTVTGQEYTYAPDTFAALVAGKQIPTLTKVWLTEPQKYIDSGVAADISDFAATNKFSDIFNSDILGFTSKDGQVYGMPYDAYAMGIGYNVKMLKDAGFDAPPKTWDELRTQAKALTKDGVYGFSMITDGSAATGWHFTVLGYTFGATPDSIIGKQADGTYKAGFGEGPLVQALQLVKDLRWTDNVMSPDSLDWAGNGTALATGKAAIAMMAGDQYKWIKTTYRETDMSNIGFAPLPAGPGGIVSLSGGNVFLVSSTASADEKEAAVYFQLWRLFDPTEVQKSLETQAAEENAAVGGPALPLYTGDYQAQRSAYEQSFYTLPVSNYQSFVDSIADGSTKLQVEPSPAGQEYYTAVGSVVSSVLTDQSVDPATALKEAADTFQSNELDNLAGS